MKVYVINGKGGCGKDTFVQLVQKHVDLVVVNLSSIDPFKEIAFKLGWNGLKDEKSRKFLSDLKQISSDFNDFPTKYLLHQVEQTAKSLGHTNFVVFLHIREPEEIEKIRKHVNQTILVRRDIKDHGNDSDDNVEDYDYDIIIDNTKSLTELEKCVKVFVKDEGFVD